LKPGTFAVDRRRRQGRTPGGTRPIGLAALLGGVIPSLANSTNTLTGNAALPDAGLSVLRVFGALALVLGLFLGGAWLFRNWQRLVLRRGRIPKLNLLEVRPLGQRHALYVVGFEDQRFLVASSPGGVNLLSHLPPAGPSTEETPSPVVAPMSFGRVLQQVLSRQ
jgi:flagellar biogenesis protein FliO